MKAAKRKTRASRRPRRASQNQPKRPGMMPVKRNDGSIVAWVHREAGPKSQARLIAEALRKAPPASRWVPREREEDFPELKEWGAISGFIPEDGEWPEAARKAQEEAFRRGYARLQRAWIRGAPEWRHAPPTFTTSEEAQRWLSERVPGVQVNLAELDPEATNAVVQEIYRGVQYSQPTLWELAKCLPYFLFPSEASCLGRVLLALNDDRVPKPVKNRLKVHLRDILRGDGLLSDARPFPLPSRPVRITPEIKRAFPSLYKSLLDLFQENPAPTKEQVCETIRERLPGWDGKIGREAEFTKVLRAWKKPEEKKPAEEMRPEGVKPEEGKTPEKPHLKAKVVLGHVFGISDKYVRLLIYGQ